jgi:hypothetical protein
MHPLAASALRERLRRKRQSAKGSESAKGTGTVGNRAMYHFPVPIGFRVFAPFRALALPSESFRIAALALSTPER